MKVAEWLPVPVAAAFFGQSHWTIRTWARRGVIRRCEQDGQVLIHTADLAREIGALRASTERSLAAWREEESRRNA